MEKLKGCLVAKSAHHSISPKIYSLFSRLLGFDVEYCVENMESDDLQNFCSYAKDNLNGFNITTPYKKEIINYLDALDNSVYECGACNVVSCVEGRLIGYNTDGEGASDALELLGEKIHGARIVIIGAGAASSAIGHSLKWRNPKSIVILNRNIDNARRLSQAIGGSASFDALNIETLMNNIRGLGILINASSLGSTVRDDFDDVSFLSQGGDFAVFDVNYSNPLSKLKAASQKLGLRFYDGRAMVVSQAALALDVWRKQNTPKTAVLDVIRAVSEY